MFIALRAIIKCVLAFRLVITGFFLQRLRNREVKFHVVMYKIVFKEGHGELAVLILIGLMQLNPSPLLIKHKRYEIRNLIMKHKLNQHRLLQRAQIYFISLENNKPHWHLDRNEACLQEHMSSS